MPMLDIFNDDAFSMVRLTDAVDKIKFLPGRVGQLGLFQVTPVSETSIAIEERDGLLKLIPPTPRGGPGVTLDKIKRTLRNLTIPKFEINDAIYASEVQNVRAWGSETAMQTVAAMVTQRISDNHIGSHAATEENARIGAIKGTITYADGSTLDLFNEFGVTAQATVDFDLDNGSPAAGALRKLCAQQVRTVADELGGTPFTGLHALCGDAFFDDLIAHSEVRETFLSQEGAGELRTGYIDDGASYGMFNFGGILWENYRGAVPPADSATDTVFVGTDDCYIFPRGVSGLFRTYYGPSDYTDGVNRPGRRLVVKQYEMSNGKGVHLDTQMNALHICTRPRVLIHGTRT